MNESPNDLDSDELLAVVRQSWDPAVEALSYLPVGFGAHHWRATVADEARYFVTLDELGTHHSPESLRAAYAGAAALANSGLGFIIAPLSPYAVVLATGAVSITPWLAGSAVQVIDRATTAAMLERLHAVDPAGLGTDLPLWRPVVGADLADRVAERVRRPWTDGPYGERARAAVIEVLADLQRWAIRYAELGEAARDRPWVPTHGEPGWHNQLVTDAGTVLVDWETLKLAPAERDLQTLGIGEPAMLELFDLEWRLDEINQYTRWFAGVHGDGEDDRIAFDGLLKELTR